VIIRFNRNNTEQVSNLMDFVRQQYAPDFYYTKNNQRIYIENTKQLIEFSKTCSDMWVASEGGDVSGIIVIWKANGGEIQRDYIKLAAKNISAADNLLTILLWNFYRDTYIKIHKQSVFLKLFYKKGFKFLSGRGSQILLKRDKTILKYNRFIKD